MEGTEDSVTDQVMEGSHSARAGTASKMPRRITSAATKALAPRNTTFSGTDGIWLASMYTFMPTGGVIRATSIEMKAIGATHLLHVTPMYNKPPQRAMLAHFRAIADGCDLPIVIYNVPGRTAINLDARSCLELAADPRFVAVKEASGNLAQITQILRERPEHFAVLSGDDALTLGVMAHGGDGVISVISNVVPALMAALCDAMVRGDLVEARRLDARLAPVAHAAFIESNPMPIKAMLALTGRMRDRLRLPLVSLLETHHPLVRAALVQAGALAS